MNEIKKHSNALSVIALLLVVKFVVLPLLTWQDEQLNIAISLEKKLVKITELIESKDILFKQSNQLKKQVEELTEPLYGVQEEELFKREQQKKIEAELVQHDLKITNIGWETTSTINSFIDKYSVNYSFSGNSEKALAYLLSIDGEQYYSDFEQFNASFSKQKSGGIGRLKVRVRRSLYMNEFSSENSTIQ